MMPYKILIVEDDPVIQTQLQTLLTGNGYTAVIADPPASAPDTVKELSPHLVLMDIRLPGESGFSLCSKIRAFSSVPIFFVTSCSGDMDELSSFLLGGDGFITKPYNTAILLAKISALLKRIYGAGGGDALSHRGAVLRPESGVLEYQGQRAELTKNELKILVYLFRNAGKICSRGDLIDHLWDNQLYVDDNALSVNIGRIREKLSAMGLNDFIRTKHRQGYVI